MNIILLINKRYKHPFFSFSLFLKVRKQKIEIFTNPENKTYYIKRIKEIYYDFNF